MSDGPYRSLPMQPRWKKVAQLAENENFTIGDVQAQCEHALLQELSKHIPKEALRLVLASFEAGEKELFPDQVSHDLSSARRLSHGSPLAMLFVECSESELAEGNVGMSGLMKALGVTAEVRSQKAIRQMEEHYLRSPDASSQISATVRKRLHNAIRELSFESISSKLLGGRNTQSAAVRMRNSVDDGVPLH